MESELVVSMFENLQHQLEKVGKRLDESYAWMSRNELASAERHTKLNADINELTVVVKLQNGSVAEMRRWKDQHDGTHAAAVMAKVNEELFIEGRKFERQRAVGFLQRGYAILTHPLAFGGYAIALVAAGWILGALT